MQVLTESSILFDRARDTRQTIYLAGAMHHVEPGFALAWRGMATKILQHRYEILDPTANKDLYAPDVHTLQYLPEEIVHADLAMIDQADIILAEVSRTNVPYHGTSIEIATAYRNGKVVYVWGGCQSYWIRYYSTQVFADLNAALDHLLY